MVVCYMLPFYSSSPEFPTGYWFCGPFFIAKYLIKHGKYPIVYLHVFSSINKCHLCSLINFIAEWTFSHLLCLSEGTVLEGILDCLKKINLWYINVSDWRPSKRCTTAENEQNMKPVQFCTGFIFVHFLRLKRQIRTSTRILELSHQMYLKQFNTI